MGVAQISVTGWIVGPTGAAIGPGVIRVTLSTPAARTDGGVDYSVMGQQTLSVSELGRVSGKLAPSPAGTSYAVRYELVGMIHSTTWTVPASPATQDISEIPT